jgi:hypothetical protein
MRVLAALAAAVALAALIFAPTLAHAGCPTSGSPDRSVCRYYSGTMIPSVVGQLYQAGGNTWLGAGFELIFYAWSDNSARRGPGQGKVSFDISALGSDGAGTETMILWSVGANVSIEKSASRAYLIPYYGVRLGATHEAMLGRHFFAEGQLGLHLWWSPRFTVDAAGGYLLPFSDAEDLAGVRGQLVLSASLW